MFVVFFFFFQAEDGIRDWSVTGVQTCALPILLASSACAVQIFDVAFSRRICCSRVWSDIRYAVLPCASIETPMIRPGACRRRSEERRVGKECRDRGEPRH